MKHSMLVFVREVSQCEDIFLENYWPPLFNGKILRMMDWDNRIERVASIWGIFG